MCRCQLLNILQFPIYGKSSNLQLLMDQVQRCYRSLSKFLKGPFWGRHFSPFSRTIFCPLCLPDPSICLPTTQRFTAWVTRQKKVLPNYTAPRELKEWCLINRLTPHTSKSEAMLISGRNPPVNIPPIFVENSTIEWVSTSRLLGITGNEKLIWTPHMLELKKSFAKKLGLLKKSRFLSRSFRQDLYFRVILPSVVYGLKLWGSCCNSDLFQSLERLYCRAARLIFNVPKDMASAEVLQRDQWPTLSIYCKSAIFICFHKALFHIVTSG